MLRSKMATNAASYGPVVLLPACTVLPDQPATEERQADLLRNLSYLREHLHWCRIFVCDNGLRPPHVGDGVQLIHDINARSTDPSIGECRNLLSGLRAIPDDTLIFKLHARCMLKNIGAFKTFQAANEEFFLVSPNIWGQGGFGYDELPYVETRVFAARAGTLRRLVSEALKLLEANGGRIEQAMLSVLLKDPADSAIAITRGGFFPIMGGRSGHGRQYGSLASKARSMVKTFLFRLGL